MSEIQGMSLSFPCPFRARALVDWAGGGEVWVVCVALMVCVGCRGFS